MQVRTLADAPLVAIVPAAAAAEPPLAGPFRRLALATAGAGAFVALLAATGWLLGLPWLVAMIQGDLGMGPVTAACVVLGATGAALVAVDGGPAARRSAAATGLAVATTAAVKLLDGHAFPELRAGLGGPLGPGGHHPATMSDYSAMALLLIGLALMAAWRRDGRAAAAAQVLALLGVAISLFVLLGYVYEVRSPIDGDAGFPMAFNAAIAIALVGVGIACADPTRGPVRILAAATPGGTMLRRLLPAFLLLPFALGWLRLQGEHAGLIEPWFGVALMTTVLAASVVTLTWIGAHRLDRQAAELRRAYDALAVADRHKDEFLAVVSHELRTPLTAVLGYLSFLQEGVVGTLTPEQQPYADRSMAGAERLSGLIDDVVEYTRIVSGKLALERQPTPYADVVHEVAAALGPAFADRGIVLAVEVDAPGLPSIDAFRVGQVLRKLLDNAVKFTPKGGRVTLTARREGGTLVTEVADTGVGLDETDRERIFAPFRQADMSATRPAGGVGLGLPISRAIVEAHGGTIGARGVPGAGCTFWFRLPAYEPAAEPGTPGGGGG